ncbi:uncharacterized protein SPSK_03033 [Sporothrix schenckii 1099-18]|uniref:HAUS augmin-like complex subunit 6 N-terminal domain-containing protein n=1 Tax=Sporothrix schenckii 1099-18 TaxID=1397361 RepID=A0A0F2LWY8_SPOSC|nr:uncharacterized protein SPSK_03033 [Sporothrix schenckii 1099-18]KJR81962.1 hypothetical protein SPSK_03033 [Sporothrix schenckii 1099-18]
MATVSSTSLLSRTRSGRLPSGKSAGHDAVTAHSAVSSASSSVGRPSASSLFLSTSYVDVFLTNLRLLDLDLRPDWPGITARTFAAKDATQGQKRRIQSVEWALFHLFCFWDPDEARTKMQPYFPPADQVQSVNLRAAFLRALETAKKTGALGRDAILRKTMLDECRGERLEEILAVFSSAVLKRVVGDGNGDGHDHDGDTSVALRAALENRGYAADRTQLHALILAYKASLSRTLRHKEAARARYRDFAELLALKERSIARRRELARSLEDDDNVAAVADDVGLRLQRLVRNNWSGSEAWMNALVYGDDRTRKDGLLSTPPDRVWRRVQAGRLGELESKTETGLLDQLDRRVAAQKERLQKWQEYSRRVLGKHQHEARADAKKQTPDETQAKTTAGIDFGFDAHSDLHPTLNPKRHRADAPVVPPHNDDYADLLRSFHRDLANVDMPRDGPALLASFLDSRKAAAKATARGHAKTESREADADADADAGAGDMESDISDIDEHPIVQQQDLLLQQQQLSAPPSEDAESPTRRRVLLTKKSMTFSVKSYHSDDEPSPPREFLSPKIKRAATIQVDQPLSPTARKLSPQLSEAARPVRRRQQSPPIRPPPNRTSPTRVTPAPVIPRTPSPDRSPPPPSPPSDDDGPFELVSTPQHSIVLQPPPATDGPAAVASSVASPSFAASPTQDLADQILASMDNASPSPVKAKRPRHTLSLAERTRMTMARVSRAGGGVRTAGDSDDENAFRGERGQDTLANRRHLAAGASLSVRTTGGNSKTTSRPARNDGKDGKAAEEVPDEAAATGSATNGDRYEDLVARTRKSMAGFEAARQKAQLDRRRSQRKSRQSSLGVGGGPAGASSSTATTRCEAAANGGGYFPPVDEHGGSGAYEEEDTTMLAEELMSGGQDDAEAIFRSRPKIKMSPIPSPTRELQF